MLGQGLSTVRLIIIGRLLGPENLGLFGVAALALATIETLLESGIERALVQKHGDIRGYLGTAFSVQLLRGLGIGAAGYLLADPIARLVGTPEAAEPLRVLAAVPVLASFKNVCVVYWTRELQFSRLLVYQNAIQVAELGVSVGLAVTDRSIWPLIWGRFAATGAAVGLSYALVRRRALPRFEWAKLRELHRFGVWVFASSIVAFALTRGGDFIVAHLLPVHVLGLYQVALSLSNAPTLQLASVVNTVSLPAFSAIQKDLSRVREAFLKSFLAIAVVVLALTALIISLAHDAVLLFLGPEWSGASELMQWLAIWGACRALGASNSTLFQALGKPQLATVFQLVMLVLYAFAVWPAGVRYGALGVVVATASVGVVVQVLRYPLLGRVLELPSSWPIYARALVPSLAAAVAVLGAGAARAAVADLLIPLRVVVVGLTCAGLYIAMLALLARVVPVGLAETCAELLPRAFARRPRDGGRPA